MEGIEESQVTIVPDTSDQTITVKGDSNLKPENIKKGVEIFGVKGTYEGGSGGSGGSGAVRQTGQRTSYGNRDDGQLQTGVALSKPRFTDNRDGTVTDNLTGLIWLKKANNGKMAWANALAFANKLKSGESGLTDGSKAGDWRLPNRFELESLLDLQYFEPVLSNSAGTGQWTEGDPFTAVQSNMYWSSSTILTNPANAWSINMQGSGVYYTTSKAGNYYVWPVRGGQ